MHAAAHTLLASAKGLARGKSPISVLRPLKGLVDSLEENLESLCQQDFPVYEIIVAAADPTDPALRVAKRVRDKYPSVAFRVLTGEWETGLNPKVRLLRFMLGKASYDGILVSDDNVRVRHDYLSIMAGALAKYNTGLVSNLVVGIGAKTVGAICENLLLNTFILSAVAASYVFGYPVVIGKSMLFRREALMNAGGFGAVADLLAEDHLLGRAIHAAGYRVTTLGYPVYTVNESWSISRTMGRHLRWCKIRSNVKSWLFPFELLAQPLLILVLTLVVVGTFRISVDGHWLAGALIGVFAVTVSEIGLVMRTQGRYFRFAQVAWLPLRSLVALIAHVGSGCVRVVRWREHVCRIGKNTKILPIKGAREYDVRVAIRRAA